MKKTKKLLSLVMACTVALSTCFVNTPALTTKADTVDNESPKSIPQTPSTQYAAAMFPGTNLGNTFDAVNNWAWTYADETIWGNPRVTKAQIDAIAAEGFKSLRIPLTVNTRLGAAPDYTIDPDFLGRYVQVVQWAVDDGLYVIVNTHHDSDWVRYYEADDDNGVTKAKYEAVWTQLANTFKNFDSKVCFESINEVMPQNHSGDVYKDGDANSVKIVNQRMSDLNTDFYNIVRGTGGNNSTRMLIMPPEWHNDGAQFAEADAKTILDLKDPNIMGAFHGYSAWAYDVGIWDGYNEDCKAHARSYCDEAYNVFVSKGIGVVQDEMWCGTPNNEPGEMLQYFEYITHYSHQVCGITPMLWDAGQALDRTNLTWKDPKLMDMLKGVWTGRDSFTASDRVFVKDQDKNSDVNIPVILNGNTLSSIYNGDTKLVEGKDYTYANSTVTLKGSYVSNLMTDGYGTKATLTFKFSAGADCDTDLIRYATPAVGSVTGSTSNFVIPVQFNGSKLKSLEATKVDGSYPHVGDCTWSSTKPFEAYTVDYTANTVTMTDKFFNNEFDKTLPQFVIKLHFQSGEVQNLLINQADGKLTYTAPVISTVPTAKVTADNSNVIIERNQSASFTVSMKNLTNANAFDVTLNYDSGLYDVSKIDYLVSGLTEVSKSDNNGNLRLMFGKTDKATITSNDYKDLVRVTLTPKSFNIRQVTSVQLVKAASASFYNGATADETCTLGQVSGTTTIKLASDIDGKGDVTLADLSIALAYYQDDSKSANWSDAQNADINGDGVVDIVDLQLIAGYIVSLTK